MPAQVPAWLLLLPLLALRGGGAERGVRETQRPPARIGVIGAGIGGTASAYFLRQKFGEDVLIDVFERGEVGGRMATAVVDGQGYEEGGEINSPRFQHMKSFVSDLGLSTLHREYSPKGVYNGEDLVFEESSCSLWNLVKYLWNYGLNPQRMNTWIEKHLDKFTRIYGYQSKDYAFSSNQHLLNALGGPSFLQLLNVTIEEAMQKAGVSQKFIKEGITPVMRVNYGQNDDIHGFIGFVSLLALSPRIWSVKGGNRLVCRGLLSASKAQFIPGNVLSLEKKMQQKGHSGDPGQQYEVTYYSESGVSTRQYDIVLIATPLQPEFANITFWNFNPPIPEISRNYIQIVTTLVHGSINATFFGFQNPLNIIVTTENPKLFINAMSTALPVEKLQPKPSLGPIVWKVFSPEPLTEEQLNLLFSSYDDVKVRNWQAFPLYQVPENVPPIILHDQLYYLSGIEYLASAMEMSAIAAKNAALLAHHRWYGKLDKIDQEGLQDRLKAEL